MGISTVLFCKPVRQGAGFNNAVIGIAHGLVLFQLWFVLHSRQYGLQGAEIQGAEIQHAQGDDLVPEPLAKRYSPVFDVFIGHKDLGIAGHRIGHNFGGNVGRREIGRAHV